LTHTTDQDTKWTKQGHTGHKTDKIITQKARKIAELPNFLSVVQMGLPNFCQTSAKIAKLLKI